MMRSLYFAGLALAVFAVGVTGALVWRHTMPLPSADPTLAVVSSAAQRGVRPAVTGNGAVPRARAEPAAATPQIPAQPAMGGSPADRPGRADPAPRANPPAEPVPPADSRPHPRSKARLAIVIDDLGHNLEAPRRLLELGLPLTFSILPLRPHSADVRRMAQAAGREFMVHLPMEPQDYPRVNPGERALLLGMGEPDTRARLAAHLQSLPGAVGANNHMGSAYTYDAAKMAIVQEMVAARGLLFLNSRTSGSRVPGRIARERGYRYLERDVFLDHDPALPAIRAQLARAAARARERGRAVAIGHPYPETLQVLREAHPALLRSGVVLVPISQL